MGSYVAVLHSYFTMETLWIDRGNDSSIDTYAVKFLYSITILRLATVATACGSSL